MRNKSTKKLLISAFIILSIFLLFNIIVKEVPLTAADHLREEIKLPNPKTDGKISIERVLSQRRSIRSYLNEELTLTEVSQILWAAYGITEKKDRPEKLRGGYRTTPSAGATYPLDIFLVAGEIESLKPGIYKYNSTNHSLIPVKERDSRNALFMTCMQPWIKTAPATIIYTVKWERITSRYGKRGAERYVFMEVGHSSQNIYLQATALGLGTVAVGAFNDGKLKELLKLGEGEDPLYMMPIGRKKDD